MTETKLNGGPRTVQTRPWRLCFGVRGVLEEFKQGSDVLRL